VGALSSLFIAPSVLAALHKPLSASGVLLTGPHGCGKSVLSLAIVQRLRAMASIPINVIFVACSDFAALRVRQVRSEVLHLLSSIGKILINYPIRHRLSNIIASAKQSQPTVIILDDLDLIAPHVEPNSPSNLPDQTQAPIVANMVFALNDTRDPCIWFHFIIF